MFRKPLVKPIAAYSTDLDPESTRKRKFLDRFYEEEENKPEEESKISYTKDQRNILKLDDYDAALQLEHEEQVKRAECTVHLYQLNPLANEKDVMGYFEKHAGRVRHAQVQLDKYSRQSLGICYLEFMHKSGAVRALELQGRIFMDRPIIAQPSFPQEKAFSERIIAAPTHTYGPSRIQVSNISPFMIADDLRELFVSFGRIEHVKIVCDEEDNSYGIGFIVFRHAEDARRAVEEMNGYKFLEFVLKVHLVIDPVREVVEAAPDPRSYDGEIFLSSRMAKAELRFRLAQRLEAGAEMLTPSMTPMHATTPRPPTNQPIFATNIPEPLSRPSKCLLLTKMFEARKQDSYYTEVMSDIEQECSKFGRIVLMAFNTEDLSGLVYIDFADVKASITARNALNARWFAGNQITAQFALMPDDLAKPWVLWRPAN